MENLRISGSIVISLLVLVVPHTSLAYSVAPHEGITRATINQYEKLSGDLFTTAEEAVMIQGSNDEDENWRFMRHFYDPVNNSGLYYAGRRYSASIYWAQDTNGQGNYNCYSKWLCNGDHIKYADKYFSSPTDFSWDRAVYEYAWGDKVRGAAALGHVLHLIQDATVPAHVRGDPHPEALADADSYETYAAKYTSGNIISQLINVPTFSGLAAAFDTTAMFANNNFLSDDTLFQVYKSPELSSMVVKDGFAVHPTLRHRVAYVKIWTDRFGNETKRKILMDNETNAVSSDYWNILSQKAIEAGTGVIDLFFREVEQEKKTGVLKARNVSAAELRAIENAKKGFKYVKALYGSSLNQSDVEELLGDNAGQAGAAALAVADAPSPPQQDAVPANPVAPTVSRTNPPQPQAAPQVSDSLASHVEEPIEQGQPAQDPTPAPPTEPQTSALAPSAGTSTGASGGSPTPTASAATQSSDTPTSGGSTPPPASDPLSLSILLPSENELFATTSATFTGTTSASAIVTAAYDSTLATTTTDDSGNWTFTLSLASGTTTVSFSAAGSTETSATSTRTVGVDVASPDAPSISIDECAASFVAGDCTIAATTATISWNAVSGAAYYDVIKDNAILATTTATLATSGISASATTTFSVVAHKSNGTAATSTEKTVFVTTQPLIINEVAWAGTKASVEDEWIELRNISNSTVDLSHFVITTPDGSRVISLSGTIGAAGNGLGTDFLVIERSAEATSLVSPYAVASDFALLADSGEQLLLQWGDGIATTTVDSTPAVATCGGWCAGAALGSIGYSIQSGTSTARLTMEREENSSDGSPAARRQTTDAYFFYGSDRSGSAMFSTAGAASSKGHPTAGWFCSPDSTSITSGAHYTPPSSNCKYIMRAISTQTNRYFAL